MPPLPNFHKFVASLRRRLRAQRIPLLGAGGFVYLPALLLLLGTVIFTLLTQAKIPFFLSEAKAIYSIPFHAGALSSIGILLWCAAASVCFLTATVLYGSPAESEKRRFLLSAGLLTSVLTLDDLFLIHEELAPDYLNLEEEIVLSFYLVLFIFFLARHIRTIFRTDFSILLTSLTFFAGSFVFDLLFQHRLMLVGAELRGLRYLLEEGSKLLGIAGWLGYFGRVCYASLVRQHSAKATEPLVNPTLARDPEKTSDSLSPTARNGSGQSPLARVE